MHCIQNDKFVYRMESRELLGDPGTSPQSAALGEMAQRYWMVIYGRYATAEINTGNLGQISLGYYCSPKTLPCSIQFQILFRSLGPRTWVHSLRPGPIVMPQGAPGANQVQLRSLTNATSISSISSTATHSTIASTTEADAGPAEEPAANEANCERREEKWEQVD